MPVSTAETNNRLEKCARYASERNHVTSKWAVQSDLCYICVYGIQTGVTACLMFRSTPIPLY